VNVKNFNITLYIKNTTVMKTMLLENQGNSCYINAGIQLIDDLSFKNEKKRSRQKPKELTTRNILQLLKNRNENDELDDVLEMYYEGVQADADEFVKTILDLLSANNSIDIQVSEVTQFLQSKNNNRYRLVKENKLAMNTLDIFINDCKTIQDCLDKSQSEIDVLEKGNYVYTHKKLAYEPEGKDLVITLKRYDYNGAKLQRKIEPESVIKFGDARYYLKGCIIHLGRSLTSGHYTYLKFNENGEPDVYISDDKVQRYKKYDLNDYLKNGYIYLYKKVQGLQQQQSSSKKKIRKRRPTVVQHLLKSTQKSKKKHSRITRFQ
jgi:uncharacterized UBP type Zn finger protein